MAHVPASRKEEKEELEGMLEGHHRISHWAPECVSYWPELNHMAHTYAAGGSWEV